MSFFAYNKIVDHRQEKQLRQFGLFTLKQAEEIGINHRHLSKLVKEQKILRMERGIYLHPKAKISREIDFQLACAKFGAKAVIGGLTALYYYNLTNQAPQETWLVVPPEQRTSVKGYRLIRTKTPLDVSVIEEDRYRIVSIERAIVEGLKLASKIGERTAIKAARLAIQNKQTTLRRIGIVAQDLGLESYFNKNFEVIVGAIEG